MEAVAIVQVRDVPDSVQRRLKAKAREKGLSLSEYLRVELEWLAAEPTLEEIVERVAALARVDGVSGAAEIHAGREERDERW